MGDPIVLDPPMAQFSTGGGTSNHAVMNQCAARVAVKIKCSDNTLFRSRPVFSIIEPGTALGIEVTRKPGGNAKEEKLVLEYAEAPEGEANPQAPFAGGAPAGKVILPLAVS